MNIQNGYKLPAHIPGTYFVTWGDPDDQDNPDGEMPNQGVTRAVVLKRNPTTDQIQVCFSTLSPITNDWVQEGTVCFDGGQKSNVLDYLRLLRDEEGYQPGSNGYYVEFANDPDGERGTCGVDPELNNNTPKIILTVWHAPK